MSGFTRCTIQRVDAVHRREHFEIFCRQLRFEQPDVGQNVVDDENPGSHDAFLRNPSMVSQKTQNRDRLGDVGLAAALPDLLLISLHGESGDRDDRDMLQIVGFLEPLRDLDAGNFRQLNVHEHEVGLVFAGEFQRR